MCETELNALNYPYTFTVVPSCLNKDEEQKFTMEILSTDLNFSFTIPENFAK